MHYDIGANDAKDIGQEVPNQVTHELSAMIRETSKRSLDSSGSSLTRIAQLGLSLVASILRPKVMAGRIRLIPQIFSSRTKEADTGADGGMIVDVMNHDGLRVMKACWIQAKRPNTDRDYVGGDDHEFERQLKQMRESPMRRME